VLLGSLNQAALLGPSDIKISINSSLQEDFHGITKLISDKISATGMYVLPVSL